MIALLVGIGMRTCAQVKPVYFLDNQIISDSTKANAYGIFGKLSTEELWVLKKYDLDNNLLFTGSYKDEKMTIPHGQFVYYEDIDFFNELNAEGFSVKGKSRFVMVRGSYENGLMNGRWIGFFPDGKIRMIITFVKGIKHGAFMVYSPKGKMLVSGMYAFDEKEGEWSAKKGRKIIKEVFKGGILQ